MRMKKNTKKIVKKKEVKKLPVKKANKKTIPKKVIKKTTPKKTNTKTFPKTISIKQSLTILHKEMEKSLKRIEILMKEVQHKEHHPKINKALNDFHKKQKKHLELITKKV